MEISRRTDYGIRLIIDLACLPALERASTRQIAERQTVPAPFLAKIVSRLSLAGLVVTHRGAGGGVSLARPPSEISLLEVVEALDGPVKLNRCLTQPDACPQNSSCPVHPVWAEAQALVINLMAHTTFDDLASAAGYKQGSAQPAVAD